MKVSAGKPFRADLFIPPGEAQGEPCNRRLKDGDVEYDYNAAFRLIKLPPQPAANLDSVQVKDPRIAMVAKAKDGDYVTVTPKGPGKTDCTLRFKNGSRVRFAITVTKEALKYLAPPIVKSIAGGRGTVTLVFHRNPDTARVGTDKYIVERSEDAKKNFKKIGEVTAPKSDRDPAKLGMAAEAPVTRDEAPPREEDRAVPDAPEPPADGPLIAPAPIRRIPGPRPDEPTAESPAFEEVSYTDTTVEPRKIYYYRVIAQSVTTPATLSQPSKPVVKIQTLETKEVQLVSLIGNKSANFVITRWLPDATVQKDFWPTRGATVGAKTKVKIDEGHRKEVDFTTGAILLDFGISPKWRIEIKKTRIWRDGRMVEVETREVKAIPTAWAILYDAKDGTRLYWREKRIKIQKKPAGEEKK